MHRPRPGTGGPSGSARRGTAAEEEMAAPELDVQCVASSAEEGETAPVQVQAGEGAPEHIQGKAADPSSPDEEVAFIFHLLSCLPRFRFAFCLKCTLIKTDVRDRCLTTAVSRPRTRRTEDLTGGVPWRVRQPARHTRD